MDKFTPNPDLTIDVVRFGQSREPMLIIDDLLTDPEDLVETAARASDWRDLPPGGYPGRRAALPADYVRSVLRRVDAPIRQTLFATETKLDRFECSFSMVTRPPNELTALQRVPHIDIARENRVAVLHYLCGPQFGGTAFFRQSETKLEQIGPKERARYLAERSQGLERLKSSNTYPNEHSPGYERTHFVAAKFNRLVVYRSFSLHSGIIDNTNILSNDPKTGRLTANFFVDYRPPES